MFFSFQTVGGTLIASVVTSIYSLEQLDAVKAELAKSESDRRLIADQLEAQILKTDVLKKAVNNVSATLDETRQDFDKHVVMSTVVDLVVRMEASVFFYSGVLARLSSGKMDPRLITVDNFEKCMKRLKLQMEKKSVALHLTPGDVS